MTIRITGLLRVAVVELVAVREDGGKVKKVIFISVFFLSAVWGRAEFLFAPTDPTPNGFFTPTLDYNNMVYEYSAWDIFYAPYGAPNYPDIFAPYGGVFNSDTGLWEPERRSDAGFPANPLYNPSNPYAFWDARNATITQTGTNTTFIIGPDASGNIYTFQQKTAYQLHNKPIYDNGLGTVIFQFQTDGTNVDFSDIRLGYLAEDGNTYYLGVNDPETEYLREYSTTGSDHWSATAGYRNRVLLQWDLSGVVGTGEFWIEWESLSSSMSFQKADLVTSETYEIGMPVSSAWGGASGEWSDSSNWQGRAGGVPQENGNLKFGNVDAVNVDIDDDNHAVGEIIFEGTDDVTIASSGDYRLISNTGITTRGSSTDAVYTFEADFEFGALNFFEINTGIVVMNGDISGNFGMVKLGDGTLELNGNNTFTQFLAVQGGTLRILGSNAYTGSTTVVNGKVIVANEQAFGNGVGPLAIGGDADLYAFTTGVSSWVAELMLEGDLTLERDIILGAGDLGKRLGAFGTTLGAEFSGDISFSGVVTNPEAPGGASAVGNTRLTAQAAGDRLVFSGAMTGGSNSKAVTIDGAGTVVYTGVNKSYNTSTVVAAGTFLLDNGTAYTGQGHWTVAAGARMVVNGHLAGNGNLTLQNGATLAGSGTVSRSFAVSNGGIIAPGNSVGSLVLEGNQTWGGGGIYQWEIGSVDGGAGTGWDWLNITGDLILTASESSRFILQIHTLDLLGEAGLLAGFDPESSYSWIIASADYVFGFDADVFTVDMTGFANVYDGVFSLSQVGGDIMLNYSAIPEPSAWVLTFLSMVLLVRMRRRQRVVFRVDA